MCTFGTIPGSNMRKIWNQMNFLLRHQVYLRVLPVVLFSVAMLGVCSLVVFERDARKRANAHQQYALRELSFQFGQKLGRVATMAELRRTRLELGSGLEEDEAVARGLLTIPTISGAALIDPHSPDGYTVQLPPALDTPQNRQELQHWQQACALSGTELFEANGSSLSGGVLVDAGPEHAAWGLRTLHLSGGLVPTKGPAGPRPHLPLLVRHQDSPRGRALLLLVDTATLLEKTNLPGWTCILKNDGTILHRRDPEGSEFLAEMDGADLLEMASRTDRDNGRLLNRWSDPWLVSSASSRVLPTVTLLAARPAGDLQKLLGRYLAFVCCVALLAMLGATLGVMRVMERISQRVHELSGNMAALSQGEYSRRMSEGCWDEIGQLVGYFNMMAASLDGAHREVRHKTLHLRAALENMRILDQAKDDFLVLISHEVRTPLTAIMGGVDFLKARLDQADPDEKALLDEMNVNEVVGIIQSSGSRLRGFMTDAIQMTAVQATDRKLKLQAIPVVDLVEVGLVGIRERAAARGIRVENQLEDRVWSLLGDPEVLKLAMEKILKNALKHNRDGGRIIIREVWEVPGQGPAAQLVMSKGRRRLEEQPAFSDWEEEELRWRLIEVFNSGEPIPEEKREALFGKFELVGSIEHHQRGSGLSLPIAQGAVACHGGRILLHSDGQDGNSFFLLLPTLLDARYVEAALSASWDEFGQGVGGASGNEEVGEVADGAALEVEVQDAGAPVAGGIDQPGGGIDGPGGADDQEEITVGGRRE